MDVTPLYSSAVSRRVVLAVPGMIAFAAGLLGHPLLCTLGLLAGSALVLRPTLSGVVEELPRAALLLVATVVLVTQGSGLFGVKLFHHVEGIRIGLAALAAIVVVVGQVRSRPDGEPVPRKPLWPVLVGAGSVALTGAVLLVLPIGSAMGWFLRSDNFRHLVLDARVQLEGSLAYDQLTYPHAWHSVVVTLWADSGQIVGYAGVLGLMKVGAASFWGLYVLLTLAAGLLARELGERCGLSPTWVALGAVGGGALMGWPQFAFALPLGFQTAVLASLVLITTLLEVVRRPHSSTAASTAVAGSLVLAHTWQLVLPAEAMIACFALAQWVKHPGRGRWARASLGAGVCLALISSFGPLAALFSDVGLDTAAHGGFFPPGTWVTSLVLFALTAFLVIRHPRRAMVVSGLFVGAMAASALLLALWVSAPVTSYYPIKVLWQAATCAVPLSAVAIAVIASRSASRRRSRWPGLLLVGPVLTLSAICFLTPLVAPLGFWDTGDMGRVLGALSSPHASSSQVVWLKRSAADSATSRILLDLYRVRHWAGPTDQMAIPVARECELLEASDHPTVLSDAPAPEVRARYGCVSRVAVLPAKTAP